MKNLPTFSHVGWWDVIWTLWGKPDLCTAGSDLSLGFNLYFPDSSSLQPSLMPFPGFIPVQMLITCSKVTSFSPWIHFSPSKVGFQCLTGIFAVSLRFFFGHVNIRTRHNFSEMVSLMLFTEIISVQHSHFIFAVCAAKDYSNLLG